MSNWLTLSDAATYCGLSVHTLRRYLRHPQRPLPARQVGRRLVVSTDDLEAWLRSFPVVGEEADLAAIIARGLEGVER